MVNREVGRVIGIGTYNLTSSLSLSLPLFGFQPSLFLPNWLGLIIKPFNRKKRSRACSLLGCVEASRLWKRLASLLFRCGDKLKFERKVSVAYRGVGRVIGIDSYNLPP